MLPEFIYQFDKGARKKEEINSLVLVGNCRLAVQLYFYLMHDFFIEPEDILCPKSYWETGEFVLKEKDICFGFPDKVRPGDVIYAQKIKNKNGVDVKKNRSDFSDEDSWITSLHTAIYYDNGIIWHACALGNGTCYWNISKFLEYYKPIAVKRFFK